MGSIVEHGNRYSQAQHGLRRRPLPLPLSPSSSSCPLTSATTTSWQRTAASQATTAPTTSASSETSGARATTAMTFSPEGGPSTSTALSSSWRRTSASAATDFGCRSRTSRTRAWASGQLAIQECSAPGVAAGASVAGYTLSWVAPMAPSAFLPFLAATGRSCGRSRPRSIGWWRSFDMWGRRPWSSPAPTCRRLGRTSRVGWRCSTRW